MEKQRFVGIFWVCPCGNWRISSELFMMQECADYE